MPELPEVETIVRDLRPKLVGLKISSFQLLFPGILRNDNVRLLRELIGKEIVSVQRRGKMILMGCGAHLSLLFHLKMTGNLLFCVKNICPDKHTHFILSFKSHERELRFRDVRKFGFMICLKSPDVFSSEVFRDLGPEPLEIDFPDFTRLFDSRKARIKSLLLDQNFISGIGNIYADEILFQAKIHPLTAAFLLHQEDKERLWEAMRKVLIKAIEKRGSSIRDYTDSEGNPGNYQNHHQVYGRESLPCRVCGQKVRRLRIGGRSSFFCPSCQNLIKVHGRDDKTKNKKCKKGDSTGQ